MKKSHVVVHCSDTKDSGTLSWPVIRRNHKALGYVDVGYQIGVEWQDRPEVDGDGHYEVMLGRPLDADGAHCPGHDMNRHSIGICFVGKFDVAGPQEEMLQVAANHLRPIMQALGIPADSDHVHPHREYDDSKTCPGLQFPMAHFIGLLR